jgi:hypothetical protein
MRKRHENVTSIVMNKKCLIIQKTPCVLQGKVAPCNIDVPVANNYERVKAYMAFHPDAKVREVAEVLTICQYREQMDGSYQGEGSVG